MNRSQLLNGLACLGLDGRLSDDDLVCEFLAEAEGLGEIVPIEGRPYYNLDVHLDAEPQRTHGVGPNLLHIDYVGHAAPPRIIGLLCLRPDPRGGGATVLAPFASAIAQLDVDHLVCLREAVFRYFPDPTGGAFGPPVALFPILPEAGGYVRFTEKMLASRPYPPERQQELIEPRHLSALAKFSDYLGATARVMTLCRGEAVFFDQQVWAHGRQALGPNQDCLAEARRRLLVQTYVV